MASIRPQRIPRTLDGGGAEMMAAAEPVRERIRDIAAPIIRALGLELVEVESTGHGPRTVIRVFIDKPGGVKVADCEEVHHSLGHALDVEDPIPHSYTLEVSSPGLDRPFRGRADYEKNIGTKVRVKLMQPRDDRWRLSGALIAVDDSGITLGLKEGRVELTMSLAWEDIGETRREIEF